MLDKFKKRKEPDYNESFSMPSEKKITSEEPEYPEVEESIEEPIEEPIEDNEEEEELKDPIQVIEKILIEFDYRIKNIEQTLLRLRSSI